MSLRYVNVYAFAEDGNELLGFGYASLEEANNGAMVEGRLGTLVLATLVTGEVVASHFVHPGESE